MKNEVKNSLLNTVLVSVCVFVGVGFISGAEIWFYFARFGSAMYFGIIFFAVLCFYLVYFALSEHEDSLFILKYKEKSLVVSELLVASAMISGLMEISMKLFSANWIFVFMFAFLVMIFVFWKGFKGVVIYNYLVAIFIVFIIINLFLFNNKNSGIINTNLYNEISFKNITLSCLFSGIYIFMNASEMHPILSKCRLKNDKKRKIFISLLITSTLIFLVFMISNVLLNNLSITNSSMPILLLFNKKSSGVKFIFLTGLILTLVSTAVACLTGVNDKIKIFNNDAKYKKLIVILSSLIIAQIPFKFFVKIIYPLIGIINFLIFILDIFIRLKIDKKLKV